ncbi:MAG: dynamin family protein [Microbacteriaceae bacterium]|nr:dynamin family protein [Microbacteriaceae bacterium]
MTVRETALHRRIERLCQELADAAPSLAPATTAIREGLGQPLRLAVVGRVKAGKSTLVNALIGHKVAPTNEAECTRVVTEYRHGQVWEASAVLRDGSTRPVPFDGTLPDELGVPVEDVSHVVVSLPAAALHDFSLIDTPGLASTTEELPEQTRRAVLGSGAARQADAIVYVFRSTERLDDVHFLREFAEANGGKPLAGSLGVLSHADAFAGGAWGAEDPIAQARDTAATMAERRRGELSGVVPFAGRMAEAARTGEVRERDAAGLARLAELPDEDVQDLQLAPFPVDGLSEAEVRDLVARFHGYPLRHGRAAAQGGANALTEWLARESGTLELWAALRARYVGRFPLLKAAHGVAVLRAAADAAPERSRLIGLIDDALIDDAAQPLEQLAAWEELRVRHPDAPETAELDALLGARDDRSLLGLAPDADAGAVADAAIAAASRTQAAANLAPDAALANAARVLSRAYLLIADEWSS